MPRFLRNNSLTLAFVAMFLFAWGGQCLTGWRTLNQERQDHHAPPITLRAYLTDAHFWEATAENWESEFLQMALFVVLTMFLFQKGSSQSKDPSGSDPVDADPRQARRDPRAPWPVRKGGIILRLYSNSLSLCFLALFLVSIWLHARYGAREYNLDQQLHHQPTVSTLGYLGTSRFWFESLQNWQSEFLSLGAMVYLTVYLRQRGSPESKPVATPHDQSE